MKKYEIRKNTREIGWKNREEIATGCTLNQANQEPEIINSFDNKEVALEELKKYESCAKEESGNAGTFYVVTEYYVEENEYNEDGEWESGGDVIEFSELDLSSVEL